MNRDAIVKLIIKHENIRLKPYVDTTGNTTVGIGRNLSAKGISYQEAIYLLSNDIDECINDLLKIFPNFVQIGEVRQVALVDMRLNLGPAGFRGFVKMIGAISAYKWDIAVKEMRDSLWAKQVGYRAEELVEMMEIGGNLK